MNCTICDNEIEVSNGDVVGLFGQSTEVAFCVWCISNLTDMMKKINGEFMNEYSECCHYPALYKIIDNVHDRWDFCGMWLRDAEFYEADEPKDKQKKVGDLV